MGRRKYVVGLPRRVAGAMAKCDKKALADWVSDGNSPLENPWLICHEDGRPFSFAAAMQFWDGIAEEMGACGEGDGAGAPDAQAIGELPF